MNLIALILIFILEYILINNILEALHLERKNFLGNVLPTARGLFPAIFSITFFAFIQLVPSAGANIHYSYIFMSGIIVSSAFCIAGFIDDLFGNELNKGFKGHIKGLIKGKITTGLIKIIIGLAASFIASYLYLEDKNIMLSLLDCLTISSTANLFNLLDTRPGRVVTLFYPITLISIIYSFCTDTITLIFFVACFLLFITLGDRKGKSMLGDTGSNFLGATIGLSIVMQYTIAEQIIFLIIILALNLLSERYSFNNIIENSPILRKLDRLTGIR